MNDFHLESIEIEESNLADKIALVRDQLKSTEKTKAEKVEQLKKLHQEIKDLDEEIINLNLKIGAVRHFLTTS